MPEPPWLGGVTVHVKGIPAMMNLFDQLFGDHQQRQDYQNFIDRYHQGPPTEGYSDQEVVQRYQQVVPNLPPQEFMQAAQEAFQRLTPEQRMQLGQQLIQSAQQQNVAVPGLQGASPQQYQDPNQLARAATQLHEQQPGILGQLLGGGGGGEVLKNPIAKAALAGITALAAQRLMNRR